MSIRNLEGSTSGERLLLDKADLKNLDLKEIIEVRDWLMKNFDLLIGTEQIPKEDISASQILDDEVTHTVIISAADVTGTINLLNKFIENYNSDIVIQLRL